MFGVSLLEIAFVVLIVLGGPIALILLLMAAFRGKIVDTRHETNEASAEEIMDRRYAAES